MKKTFLLSALLMLVAMMVNAQDANEIVERYKKAINMPAAEKFNGRTAQIDMETSMMGMSIPSTTIMMFPDKMRTEVSAMGMTQIMVMNGKKGWISIPGNMKQELPADQLEALASQGDPMGMNKWDASRINTEYVGTGEVEGKPVDKVKVCNKDNTGCFVASFDKASGLLVEIDMNTNLQGKDVVVKSSMKDYKTFDGMLVPTTIEAATAGMNTTVKIKDIKYDVTVTDETFAEPK